MEAGRKTSMDLSKMAVLHLTYPLTFLKCNVGFLSDISAHFSCSLRTHAIDKTMKSIWLKIDLWQILVAEQQKEEQASINSLESEIQSADKPTYRLVNYTHFFRTLIRQRATN